MKQLEFDVLQLAMLCDVDRDTIRRWRNEGVRGVKLQATTDEAVRGKRIMFSAAAIYAFAEVYPKIMTPALQQVLGERPAPEPIDEATVTAPPAPPTAVVGNEYLKQLLLEKREALLKELEQVDAASTASLAAVIENDYLKKLLQEKRGVLLKELAQADAALRCFDNP